MMNKEFDTDPMVPFPPVVEPDIPGAFITEHPRNVITAKSLQIPLITGVTYDEGLLKTAGAKLLSFFSSTIIDETYEFVSHLMFCIYLAYFGIPSLFDEFAANLEYALPIALYYDHHDPSVQEPITKAIKKFYFDNNLTREKDLNVTNVKIF